MKRIKLPTKRQIKNLSREFGQVARHWSNTGRIAVADDEKARRLQICEGCVEWFDRKVKVCDHPKCGCKMRVKTIFEALRCPIGKW